MSNATMPSVVPLGLHAVELSGTLGHIALWGLDQQVVMVIHETKGMAQPVVALNHVGEQIEECLPVRLISVDGGLGVPTAGYMVEGTTKCNPQRSTHG